MSSFIPGKQPELVASKVVFFVLKDKKYVDANGNEITTEMLVEHRHHISGDRGYLVLEGSDCDLRTVLSPATKKECLISEVNTRNSKILVLLIETPGGAKETITVPESDMVTKMYYIQHNYDDNLCLRANSEVRIEKWIVG
jgi:hypothetical protein